MLDADRPHLWSRWLYLRILGLLYIAAFLSFSWEIVGLAGPAGLFPAAETLAHVASREPGVLGRLLAAPTIFWLGSSADVLEGCCWVGAAAAVLVATNCLPRFALFVCWVCYLSLLTSAPSVSWYPSDGLLLEATLLAIFAAPSGFRPGLGSRQPLSGGILFLFGWLLFRLMLETGVCKIRSNDPIWRSLGTMDVFLETGPFPTWLAWYGHKLPHLAHQIFTAYVLFAEIVCSVLLFLGRRIRLFALTAWMLLQAGILLTGNFNNFNYHSIALAILLTGDDGLRRVLPLPAAGASDACEPAVQYKPRQNLLATAFLSMLFAVTFLTTLAFFHVRLPAALSNVQDAPRFFRSTNIYRLYPTIPRQRRNVVFEASDDDGKTWKPYPFRFQTQRLDERPRFIAPFQPRFDREASRVVETEPPAPYTKAAFVFRTARRLLECEPSVVALFAENPFPDSCPNVIRTIVYRYRFTDSETRRATGNWWSREELGPYSPHIRRDPVTGEIRYDGPEQQP